MIFVLYVMCVVGSVPLWIVCVSCRCCVLVSVVHPVAILKAVFCIICSLLMFVSDASGDRKCEYFEYLYCLAFFYCCDFYVFVVYEFGVESQS